MAMFADDTTIMSSKRKGLCSIQLDMDDLSQWFRQNRLSIKKCETDCIRTRSSQGNLDFRLKNSLFERVQVFRCLRGQNFALQRTY